MNSPVNTQQLSYNDYVHKPEEKKHEDLKLVDDYFNLMSESEDNEESKTNLRKSSSQSKPKNEKNEKAQLLSDIKGQLGDDSMDE